MPYVEVKVAGELSKQQKQDIVKGISDLLHKVAGKNPETTYIVINEISRDKWAVGDKFLSEK